MSTFKLSLPTDIPWKRICLTKSMLQPDPCGAILPRWNPSIAVFRYDPAPEYQPFDDMTVSYLKVVVTVAPFVSELTMDLAEALGLPMFLDDLEEAYPCYGALIHVAVAPKPEERGSYSIEQYPYFTDFEPKKRELYEGVTDTGEVLSGSSTTLGVGKNATNSSTTENYNLDTGWNFGRQMSYAGTGGGHNIGQTGDHGSVNRSGLESTTLRTAEASTERRELQSHVTQLAQMYNLFQAFHLGTNRALFFLEPRPHIRQAEASFINGPRALEGLQEIFLVTVRPKQMADFCVGVTLETAHLSKTPVYEAEAKSDLFNDFRLSAQAENKDVDNNQNDFTSDPISLTKTYFAPDGFEIVGYDVNVLQSQRVQSGPTVTYTASQLTVYGEVTWRFWESGYDAIAVQYPDHYENGILNVDVVVKLRQKPPVLKEYVRKLFLKARNLCCCAGDGGTESDDSSVVFSSDLQQQNHLFEVYSGPANPDTFVQSRQLAALVRSEMVRSMGSSRRVPIGKEPFARSDVFFTRVADVLHGRRSLRELAGSLSSSRTLPERVKARLEPHYGGVAVGAVLAMDANTLSRRLRIPREEVVAMKEQALHAIAHRVATGTAPGKPRTGSKK